MEEVSCKALSGALQISLLRPLFIKGKIPSYFIGIPGPFTQHVNSHT